jgi:predicted nuclease of predicted toxin-antitoxin system
VTPRGSTSVRRRHRRTRLLFDELLPPRVAAALRALGHPVSHVGNEADGQPRRGSPDEEVLEHCRRTNQIVVTSNHDMILLCVEQGQTAVWVDPRGRQFTRERLAILFLEQILRWEAILAAAAAEGRPVIVRSLRTRVDPLLLSRAKSIVMRRQRALRRKKRATTPKPKPLGGLVSR